MHDRRRGKQNHAVAWTTPFFIFFPLIAQDKSFAGVIFNAGANMSSPRRKPGSRQLKRLKTLDSGFRRNDGILSFIAFFDNNIFSKKSFFMKLVEQSRGQKRD